MKCTNLKMLESSDVPLLVRGITPSVKVGCQTINGELYFYIGLIEYPELVFEFKNDRIGRVTSQVHVNVKDIVKKLQVSNKYEHIGTYEFADVLATLTAILMEPDEWGHLVILKSGKSTKGTLTDLCLASGQKG